MFRISSLLLFVCTFLFLGCSKDDASNTVIQRQGVANKLSRKTNEIGMTFIQIPAGSFKMGLGSRGSNEVLKDVELSSFYLLDKEVTVGQFKEFDPNYSNQGCMDEDCPAIELTREEVRKYIEWISKQDGRQYALPTEAQWEYAARGGLEGKDYPWGNKSDESFAYIGSDGTVPTGSYPPNGYGLFDMCGNAWEMVRESDYSYDASSARDPVGPVDFDSELYVVRGLGSDVLFPQVWFRTFWLDSEPGIVGFRLVFQEETDSSEDEGN